MDLAPQRDEAGLARWRGRVALVTGASSGIGEAAARALGGIGMRLALTARRTDRLAALQDELEAGGSEVLCIPADLAGREGPGEVFAAVRGRWGGVDVLVNNAGLGVIRPFTECSVAALDAILDVNVRALALCTREALRDLEGKAEGAIINIASLSAYRVPTGGGFSLYTASKSAVQALTNGLRNELAQTGRTVKLGMISPGVVATEFFDKAADTAGGGEPPEHPFEPLRPADVAAGLLHMLGTPPHVQINDIIMRPVHQPT